MEALEARVPLLDHRVVEFTFKVRGGESKWLLRRVLDRYVSRQSRSGADPEEVEGAFGRNAQLVVRAVGCTDVPVLLVQEERPAQTVTGPACMPSTPGPESGKKT